MQQALTVLGQRLRQAEQRAGTANERAAGLQRQLDDARAAADRERERRHAAEAHLTAFTVALAAGGLRLDRPDDPAAGSDRPRRIRRIAR